MKTTATPAATEAIKATATIAVAQAASGWICMMYNRITVHANGFEIFTFCRRCCRRRLLLWLVSELVISVVVGGGIIVVVCGGGSVGLAGGEWCSSCQLCCWKR